VATLQFVAWLRIFQSNPDAVVITKVMDMLLQQDGGNGNSLMSSLQELCIIIGGEELPEEYQWCDSSPEEIAVATVRRRQWRRRWWRTRELCRDLGQDSWSTRYERDPTFSFHMQVLETSKSS
jgi:hypothetical protein